MKKLFLKIFMISFLFCTVACGDKPAGPVDGENGIPGENGDNPGGEETPKDEILEFSVTGDFELDEGETTKYVVTSNLDIPFLFELDNDKGMIDKDGNFEAFEAGTIILTVTPQDTKYQELAKTFTIIINKVYPKCTGLFIETETAVKVGGEINISVKVLPNTAKQEYYYVVENEEIGYIENDVFKALKTGVTKITIVHIDEEIKEELEFTVFEYEVNNDIYLYPGVSRAMTSAEFWINQHSDKDEVILSVDKIKEMNTNAYKVSGTKLVDINNQPSSLSGSTIKGYINKYTINSSYRVNGQSMSSTYKTDLTNNVNIKGVPDAVEVKYGVINEFSALRSFPTSDIATSSNDFDRWQETGLEVGQGCLIYHESLDGKWLFVQVFNYNGWVLKDKVTVVSKDQMLGFTNPENFIIVTGKFAEIGGVKLRMSTKLPVISSNNNEYTVLYPNKDGIKIVRVPLSNDINYGYLPYTKANILIQIFKQLDDKYRWGDCALDGHDCSSTMNAVYACFGFDMPRNTSNQEQLPYGLHNVTSSSDSQKKQILDHLSVGSLVFVSGHVMMYLGKVGNDYYIIHNFNSYGGCNITTTNLIRSGSTTYLTAFTKFMEMK